MATSGDIKGIIEKFQSEEHRALLKQPLKKEIKRPAGISREVFALMTEEELAKLQEEEAHQSEGEEEGENAKKEYAKILKAIKNKDRVDKWIQYQFTNPARTDESFLKHWTKEKEKDEMYPFAKFNKCIDVILYTEEEYKNAVSQMGVDPRKPKWSKSDTDLLFQLCEQFQLRFINITDRFNFIKTDEAKKKDQKFQQVRKRDRKCKDLPKDIKKTPQIVEKKVEEIKDRYYSVSKAVLEYRKQNDHVFVSKPFDYFQEKKRKENIEKLFVRTKYDNELEKILLQDLKKLDQLIKKTEKEEKQLEKLVNNEKQRQDAFQQQQQMIQQKIEISKSKLQERHQEIEVASLENIPPIAKKVRKQIKKGNNSYLVSEKLYEYFQKHAQLYKIDENIFDKFLKEAMNKDLDFSNIFNSQLVLEKWVEIINKIQENIELKDQIKIRKDFIDICNFGEKRVAYNYEPGTIGIKSKVVDTPPPAPIPEEPKIQKKKKTKDEIVEPAADPPGRSQRAAKTNAAQKITTQNKMEKVTQKQYSKHLKQEDVTPKVAEEKPKAINEKSNTNTKSKPEEEKPKAVESNVEPSKLKESKSKSKSKEFKPEKVDKAEKASKIEKADNVEKVEKVDKVDKPQEKSLKTEKTKSKSKEPKATKEQKASKESKQPIEPIETKQIKEEKPVEDKPLATKKDKTAKEGKAPKEVKPSKQPKEAKIEKPKELKEPKEPKEPKEFKEPKDSKLPEPVPEVEDKPKETKAKAPKIVKESKQKVVEKPKETKESKKSTKEKPAPVAVASLKKRDKKIKESPIDQPKEEDDLPPFIQKKKQKK